MPTRNVVLIEHQAPLIETLVGSGRNQNASEVMREGLRMVERCEADDAAKLEALLAAARVRSSGARSRSFRLARLSAITSIALLPAFVPSSVSEWRHRNGASASVQKRSRI